MRYVCFYWWSVSHQQKEWRSKYQEKEEEEGVQNFLNRAHQTDTDSNNILNVLCIILSAYLDIFSFTYTSHKTDVHQSQLEMFIGVVYVHKCLAAHCCCRSYVMRSKYFNLAHSWYISFHCLCYMYLLVLLHLQQ